MAYIKLQQIITVYGIINGLAILAIYGLVVIISMIIIMIFNIIFTHSTPKKIIKYVNLIFIELKRIFILSLIWSVGVVLGIRVVFWIAFITIKSKTK